MSAWDNPNHRPILAADLALLHGEPGHEEILLVKRKWDPFSGLWAIPGGGVEPGESAETAAKRELLEETGLASGEIVQLRAVSDPERDPRGWVVSVVFVAKVQEKQTARAADDAVDAQWFSVRDLPELAFDHKDILSEIVAKLDYNKQKWLP